MVEAVAAGASLLQRHGDRCRQVAELLLPRLTHMQASCIDRWAAENGFLGNRVVGGGSEAWVGGVNA